MVIRMMAGVEYVDGPSGTVHTTKGGEVFAWEEEGGWTELVYDGQGTFREARVGCSLPFWVLATGQDWSGDDLVGVLAAS